MQLLHGVQIDIIFNRVQIDGIGDHRHLQRKGGLRVRVGPSLAKPRLKQPRLWKVQGYGYYSFEISVKGLT